jgi:hypothetical protein
MIFVMLVFRTHSRKHAVTVLYPGKGECADPVNEGAMLGKGGPSPHGRDRERQLAPDTGRGET